MIHPKILKEFTAALGKLVGQKLDEINTSGLHDASFIIGFATKNRGSTKEFYMLTTLCAWHILKDDLVLYTYFCSLEGKERTEQQLRNLQNRKVSKVLFDAPTLNLRIDFDSQYSLKLLHNQGENWHYKFSTDIVLGVGAGQGLTYEIGNESIFPSGWRN
jgi:hypothetical protein